ncbi:hypothetical protein GCM10023238_03000 [Streptomyces heliomycini]
MATDEVDVVIKEVGGTVGDIESLPFWRPSARCRHEVGRDNVFVVHISLLPLHGPSGELKTKPTQHSVAALRKHRHPAGRDRAALRPRGADRDQAEDLADVRRRRAAVSPAPTPARSTHPKVVHSEGLDAYVVRKLDLPFRDVDWTTWTTCSDRVHNPTTRSPSLVGKYIDLPDAYLSVIEALRAGGFAHKARVKIKWVTSDDCKTPAGAQAQLGDVDGICIPGGFGDRGVLGKVGAIKYAAEPDPAAGPVPGPAVHRDRGRAQSRGHLGRQLHRVRPGHRPPGDLHHGRADGHRRR